MCLLLPGLVYASLTMGNSAPLMWLVLRARGVSLFRKTYQTLNIGFLRIPYRFVQTEGFLPKMEEISIIHEENTNVVRFEITIYSNELDQNTR